MDRFTDKEISDMRRRAQGGEHLELAVLPELMQLANRVAAGSITQVGIIDTLQHLVKYASQLRPEAVEV